MRRRRARGSQGFFSGDPLGASTCFLFLSAGHDDDKIY